MHRIDHSTAVAGLFVPSDAQLGQAATQLTPDWCNDLQESIAHVIESTGGALIKNDYTQLSDGIAAIARNEGVGASNLLFNAGFTIWQRGTSRVFPVTDNLGDFGADRWHGEAGDGSGAATFALGTHATPGPDGERYYGQWNQTGSSTSVRPHISQEIEDVRRHAGKTFALQFRVALTSGTTVITPKLLQDFGSGGSADVLTDLGAVTLTGGSTFTTYTVTGTVPSISGKTIGAGSFLSVQLTMDTGATYTVQFDRVQFQEGFATAFEIVPLVDDLRRCQRYFFKTYPEGYTPGAGANNSGALITRQFVQTGEPFGSLGDIIYGGLNLLFPVPMRAAPTVIWWNPNDGTEGEIFRETVESSPTNSNFSPANSVGTSYLQTGPPRTTSTAILNKYHQLRAHVTADAEFL